MQTLDGRRDLGRAAQPHHDSGGGGVPRRELQGQVGQGDAVRLGHARPGAGLLEQRGRRGPVVVARVVPRPGAGEQPRVVGSGAEHRDAALLGLGHQRLAGPVHQRPATGHHHHVDRALADDPEQRLDVPHPDAHRPDHALLPQFDQCGDGLGDGLVQILLGVVHEDDVHPVQAEPLEALVEAAADPVGGVVPPPHQVVGDVEQVGVTSAGPRVRLEQPAHLGRHHELLPRPARQGCAEPPLRQAQPVVRGRVEVAEARVPGRVERRPRLLVGQRGVQVAEGRCAEAQLGDLHLGAAEPSTPQAARRLLMLHTPSLGPGPGAQRAATSTRTLPTAPASTAACASAVCSSGKRTSGSPASSPTGRAPSRSAAVMSSAATASGSSPTV